MKDFSLDMLSVLLKTFKKNNYKFIRFSDYWKESELFDNTNNVILLRHDVDRFPGTALATARLENELGIKGTYYFRVKPHTLKKEIISEISKLGHEIGYHYETLADCNGNFNKARELFANNLKKLREITPIHTCSMHSRPLSKWDNRLIWEKYSLKEFNLIGETYRSINHNKYLYLADSGRNWGADRNVVWDTVNGIQPPEIITGTTGLCNIVNTIKPSHIQLLIHPNRWPNNYPFWLFQKYSDSFINLAKTIIKSLKK